MKIVTEVYFVRHGQSEANRQHCKAGWSDTPLSPLGRQQALETAKLFEDIQIDQIFSSDLPRAVETCRRVLPGREPQLCQDLREVSVGSLEGRANKEIRAENPEALRIATKYQDFSFWGGESNNSAKERIWRFVEEKLNTLPEGSKAAVFGHEGTILYMLDYVLEQNVLIEKLQMDNAAIFKFVRYENGKWKLNSWNYRGAVF